MNVSDRIGNLFRTPNLQVKPVNLLIVGMVFAAAGGRAGAMMNETTEKTQLIPRQTLFGNPDKAQPAISADGKHISFLAPRDGVLNIWVAPADNPANAKPITHDKDRGIRQHFWAYSNDHIIYLQDSKGDENWRIYIVNLKTNETRDATPFENVQARIEKVSHKFPNEVLVSINKRNEQLHDVYKLNLQTGDLEMILENEGYLGFEIDDDYNVRFASTYTPDGGIAMLKRTNDGFEPFLDIPKEDSLTTQIFGFNEDGTKAYMADSRGRNTAACVAMDIETGKTDVVAQNDRADMGKILIHPTTHKIEAVGYVYDRLKWEFLDETVKKDFEKLRKVCKGDIEVVGQTEDNATWIVEDLVDAGPVRYYLFNRNTGESTFLFTNRTKLENLPLATMHAPIIKSRDGKNLVSYLTLPRGSDPDNDGKPINALPLVLDVHGGPWARDEWGYNPVHQWLANRGYAVLNVNFRGSTGLGKDFINAADMQWGRTMHDDLLDGVNWAIEQGIADKERVAIFGGSYGGYATLWGMTNTPEVFACGVDIVGPSNLLTLINSIPPYWAPVLELFAKRVGDPRTDEGRRVLEERSPLNYVDNLRKPLLIGQGANDPRVKQAESDQIVKAMEEKGIPVTYVLYPDEGHGFAKPENSLSFWAITEAFLAEHLGGRFEPVGDDFAGSSVQVISGAEQVPGISDALKKK